MTTKKIPAKKTPVVTTPAVVTAVASALRFARSMAPRNQNVKQSADTPAPLLRKNLKAKKQKMLDVALDLVYREGIAVGKAAATKAPIAETAIARVSGKGTTLAAPDSEAERIGRILLDPNTTTTKAILMMQLARSKRGLK